MTSQEVVDYVMKTPNNTNPVILSQMLKDVADSGNQELNNNKEFLFRKKFENYDDSSGKVSDGKFPEATTYDFDLEEMRTIFDKGEFPNITLEISWDYEERTFSRKLINPLTYIKLDDVTGLVINIFFVNVIYETGVVQPINFFINTNTGIVSIEAHG